MLLPVRRIVQRRDSRIRTQDRALRVLVAPERKRELVRRNQCEVLATKVTEDALAGALLPDAGGFGVAQKCVAVVDAGEMEVERAAVDDTAPDKTGMAERAVGDRDGLAADDVVDDVVIAEVTDWVGARLAVEFDGEQHIARIDRGFRCGRKGGHGVRVEHALEDVDMRCNETDTSNDHGSNKTCADCSACAIPRRGRKNQEDDDAEQCDPGSERTQAQCERECVRIFRNKRTDDIQGDSNASDSNERERGGADDDGRRAQGLHS